MNDLVSIFYLLFEGSGTAPLYELQPPDNEDNRHNTVLHDLEYTLFISTLRPSH